MSRWIDIDDISLLKTVSVGGLSAKALWKRIRQEPSIDLVFCEECIHFTKLSDGWGRCNVHDRIAQTIDFCSWAERKESDE
jgi:hypothetical protein